MRLIDADAFDRALCNHEFTAALNDAADEGTAFEDKKMYYSTQSFRDVMKHRPTIDAVPLDKLCEYLNSVIYPCIICKESPGPQCNAKRQGCWERVLKKWMEEETNESE